MTRSIFIALIALAAGFSVAHSFESKAERYANEMAKYEQSGEMQKCIRYNMIKRTKVLDDTHIIFEMKNRKTLLNTLQQNCRPLGFTRQFSYNVFGNRLCVNDSITVLDNMDFRGSCSLSEFEVLNKIE